MTDETHRFPLTVVVPTRDRPRMLDGCLASLCRVMQGDDEVIVVDSASEDPDVRRVAEKHGVTYIRTDIPGASRARNIGWQNAASEIVVFVDDDVRVAEDWRDAISAAFSDNPDATFVTGRILAPEGQEDQVRPIAILDRSERTIFTSASRGLPGHGACLAVRREALELVGGFDERMGAGGEFKAAEEIDLYDRLYALGRIGLFEPTVLSWHEQWRSPRQLLKVDYSYGFGSGARLAKLMRTNRIQGLKYARALYLHWGLLEVFGNIRHRHWLLASTALARLVGAILGFARTIPIPISDGHFAPKPEAFRDGSPTEEWSDGVPRLSGSGVAERDRASDRRLRPAAPVLRVGMDYTPGAVAFTGIARYSRVLWDELESRPDVAVRAFAAGRAESMESNNIFRLRMPVRVLHSMWRLGFPRAETILGNVDVVHCIDMLPPPTKRPLVMTWHDTFRLAGPEYHDPRNLELREQRINALGRASVVLTYCEATAQELVEATGYPRERIVLSPPGYDLPETTNEPPPVEGPFILAAGALTPRKGFEVLARAVRQLGDDAPPLVIAGPDGHGAEQVRRQIFEALPPQKCILLGERYESMSALYQQATIVCHPSLAEGFGYVCLEAMGAGAAVVAADIPSIREMGEGCVSLVGAGDADAMAFAIRSLLEDDEERARLSKLGHERARSYTWRDTADQTVLAYHMAAER